MRRVVVTGLGIVSSIGNNAEEVEASLKAGKSGIEGSPEMAEHGFRSQVAGTLKIDPAEHVDKRTLRPEARFYQASTSEMFGLVQGTHSLPHPNLSGRS